jgi:hypothetical protein
MSYVFEKEIFLGGFHQSVLQPIYSLDGIFIAAYSTDAGWRF